MMFHTSARAYLDNVKNFCRVVLPEKRYVFTDVSRVLTNIFITRLAAHATILIDPHFPQ